MSRLFLKGIQSLRTPLVLMSKQQKSLKKAAGQHCHTTTIRQDFCQAIHQILFSSKNISTTWAASNFQPTEKACWCGCSRVWHFGFETFVNLWVPQVRFRKIGSQKKVLFSVSEYLFWKQTKQNGKKDKNKSKYKGAIVTCWQWYWSLNLITSIIDNQS